MQCMAALLLLWCGLQCAWLVLDTRYALEYALEQMYMRLLTIVPFAACKWLTGSYLQGRAGSIVAAAPSGFSLSTLAKDPSAVMGIMTTMSGLVTWFVG